jgi:hypothetical protein
MMQSRFPRVAAIFALCGLLLATATIYFWLVSYGTWSLAGSELWSDAFDSLAKHLQHFDASVNQDAIDWEGLTVGSRTTMYFGPFPALLRIVPNLAFPNMYGLWARPSSLLAALLALMAAVATFRSALTAGGRILDHRGWLHLTAAAIGFGLGTPVVYLVSCGRIYHESILWALCGSLWGVYFIVRLATGQASTRHGLLGLSASFAVTLLARVTFALPLALALVVLTARALAGTFAVSKARTKRASAALLLALAVSPTVAGVGFQLWYDYDRFGSIWDINRINSYVHPEEIGGTFNLRRVPSALNNYFGLRADSLPSRFPFFRLAYVRYGNKALFFDWREEALSLTLGSSWLILGAVLGALALLRRPRSGWTILIVLCFAVQAIIISTYYFVTERFAAEYLPFLMLLYSVYLAAPTERRVPHHDLSAVVLVLAVFSTLMTVGGTIQWNQAVNTDVPTEYKIRLARLFFPAGSPPNADGNVVQLVDLEPLSQYASFAPMTRNTTFDGFPIVFNSVYYRTGLGMHATGRATYAVPAGATAFWAVAGLPDNTTRCEKGSVVFELRDQADRVLYRSPTIRTGDDPQQIKVGLEGVRSLTLVVDDAGDGPDCDHAAWGMPVFMTGSPANGSR